MYLINKECILSVQKQIGLDKNQPRLGVTKQNSDTFFTKHTFILWITIRIFQDYTKRFKISSWNVLGLAGIALSHIS